MEKILLLSDSASDISLEEEQKLTNVRIINIPLCFSNEERRERVDITNQEMYQHLNTCTKLPTSARLNSYEFLEEYIRAWKEGYDHVIYLGLNSKGSGTFEASLMAKEIFFKNYPDLVGKFHITNVDGRCYSYGYGFPLFLAAKKLEQGASAQEIIDFLVDFIDHRCEYLAMFTLKFTRKSGRVSATAGFVGDILGLRPIMGFPNGENTIYDKVRGNKAVVPRLFSYFKEKVDPDFTDYCILYGEDYEPARELIELIKGYTGKEPVLQGEIGTAVAINAGPQIVGVCFKGKTGGNCPDLVH